MRGKQVLADLTFSVRLKLMATMFALMWQESQGKAANLSLYTCNVKTVLI